MARKDDGREQRMLAKPLVQAGIECNPGDTVRLRPDQIARLEAQGYFEPTAKPKGARSDKEGAQ